MNFEPVHEVSEYYDGPRAGIALFNGDRYRFRSRFLDVTECKGDFESVDIFELAPLESSKRRWFLATAEFRVVANQPEPKATGELRQLEVAWQVIAEFTSDPANC